jgi:hypothetical protein
MKKTKSKQRNNNNNNKDNIISINNNTNIIGHPLKPNNITYKILRHYFKELLLIGNINVALDVSKIGRRRGKEWLKRGKIAAENNIVEDMYYWKFFVLSTRTHARWISKSIQKLQETNNKGGNNLQWLLEQQAPDDFRQVQVSSDSNAMNLIFALQNQEKNKKLNSENSEKKS